MSEDYRVSGADGQGQWTLHGTDGAPIRFRGGWLQFPDGEFAKDLAHLLSMARQDRLKEKK